MHTPTYGIQSGGLTSVRVECGLVVLGCGLYHDTCPFTPLSFPPHVRWASRTRGSWSARRSRSTTPSCGWVRGGGEYGAECGEEVQQDGKKRRKGRREGQWRRTGGGGMCIPIEHVGSCRKEGRRGPGVGGRRGLSDAVIAGGVGHSFANTNHACILMPTALPTSNPFPSFPSL